MRGDVLCIVAAVAFTAGRAQADADEGAKKAAKIFGDALVAGSAALMMPILPEHGKVHLSLARLGPEEGRFSANQVVAVFRDFLASGKVTSFEIQRCESDAASSALAHGRAIIVDRQGRGGRIGLHLGFEPEGARWVLREVKESAE